MADGDVISGQRQRFLDAALRQANYDFDHALSACDSPIEKIFMAELLAQCAIIDPPFDQWAKRALDLSRSACPAGQYPSFQSGLYGMSLLDAFAIICAQCPVRTRVKDYRLDFAVLVEWPSWRSPGPPIVARLAIECDGHDFHERTKEQAASDRSRDRDLVANGWMPIRFTGSEIYRNPGGCVQELERIIMSTDPEHRL